MIWPQSSASPLFARRNARFNAQLLSALTLPWRMATVFRILNWTWQICTCSALFCSLRSADVFPVVTHSPSEKWRLRTRAAKRFPWRRTSLVNHKLALKIKELTRETSRKIVRGAVGYVYKSKLKGRRSLCTAALFPQNDAFTKVYLPGLWDWLMK